ncbi:MAG: cyclase family protein [Clostridiales bacterium]|nr:cyclase family protein [Clostridiales bacterium]
MKILDLSMRLYSGMSVFPGDPAVNFEQSSSFPQDVCRVTRLSLGSHTGTHIDAPSHFLPQGASVTDLDLHCFIGEAICVKPRMERSMKDGRSIIDLSSHQRKAIREGDRVIFSTGWEEKAGTPEFFIDYPLFSEELIEFLRKKRLILLGADLPTFAGRVDPFRMHRDLFAANTVFAEGLVRTAQLPEKRFFFSAAPLRIENGDGCPVRAYAIVDG